MNIALAIWSIKQQDMKQHERFWWALAKHDFGKKEERQRLHCPIEKKENS